MGLIEAHGTGTRVGDKIEFTALKTLARETRKTTSCAVGSVKSMIGHSKAAAGAAGIIKSALCLYHKVLPPTLKAEEPDPELEINDTPFYLNAVAKPWVSQHDTPRRSGVSAFGFGGSNFHAVLEEDQPEKSRVSWDGTVQIAAFSAPTRQELTPQLVEFSKALAPSAQWDHAERSQAAAWLAFNTRKTFSASDNARLIILITRDDDAAESVQRAMALVETQTDRSWTKENIYFGSGQHQGKLAFLFPGQGSQYTGMGRDLVSTFPEGLKALTDAGHHFTAEWKEAKQSLADYIFPPPLHRQDKKTSEEMLRKTDVAQPALGGISLAMAAILARFNILPDLTCGHSFGELPALYCAGWMDRATLFTLACARGRYMAQSPGEEGEQGSMLAVKAALPDIEALIRDENLDLVLANRNSHDQGVLSGRTDEIKRALKRCRARKIRAVEIPVAAAFHSPLVENAARPFKDRLEGCDLTPSATAVFSNTTAVPYPNDVEKATTLLGNQLLNPVNFVDSVEAMFADNATTFVEVGPKSVLTGLTRSILKDKAFTAMALDGSNGRRSGMEDLARVVCELGAKGLPVDLTAWEDDTEAPGKKIMRIPLTGANIRPRPGCDLPPSPPMTTVPVADRNHPVAPAQTNETPGSASAPEETPRGAAMPSSDHPVQPTQNPIPADPARSSAMALVLRGLESMEALQSQTARAHEKFLETQALASQTLQKMMAQTRLFSDTGFTPHTAPSSVPAAGASPPSVPGSVVQEPLPETAPRPLSHGRTPPHEAAPEPQPAVQPLGAQPLSLPDPPATEPSAPGTTRATQAIMATVSRLTGFPQEMLNLNMDIESDLGIDSIKRVEIVSELEKELPHALQISPEEMGSLKTLGDILSAMAMAPSEETGPEPELAVENSAPQNPGIMATLVKVIGELTGFPVEMLEPGMDLESDLGIDSIKRVEILSRLEKELPHADTFSAEKMTAMKTLADIAAHIDGNGPSTSAHVAAGKEPPRPVGKARVVDAGSVDEDTSSTAAGQTTGNHGKGRSADASPAKQMRQTIRLKQLPMDQVRFHNGSKLNIGADKTVYIAGSTTGFSAALAQAFKRTGIDAQLISMDQVLNSDLTAMAGLVIVYDPDQGGEAFLKSAFALARKSGPALMAAASGQAAFFTTVSFLGGGFGFDDGPIFDPLQGGLSGLAKTAALEWPTVLCRSLDLAPEPVADNTAMDAISSLTMIHGPVEMGIRDDLCNIPELVTAEATPETATITPDDVFVISGGARGVTAQCAMALADRYQPAIVLLGRSPEPWEEPGWLTDLVDEADIKRTVLENEFIGQRPSPRDLDTRYRQIVSNREITSTLKRIRSTHARVAYRSVDVLDAPRLAQCLKTVEGQFGTITGLVHGAGVLEDRFILDKDDHQFARVFDTKVQGLNNILAVIDPDRLAHLVLFSSIAARTGNPGQVDYAMANEVLNKTAQHLARRLPACKVLAMNWGPWEGGMVTPLLRQKFEKQGIDLIPLKAGAAMLMDEMTANGPVEIVIGGHLPAPPLPEPKPKKRLTRAYGTEVDTTRFPILNDHCIDDQPVVPFALMAEWYAHGACHANPGLVFAGIDNMRVLKGIKPDSAKTRITINTGRCTPDKDLFRVETELCSTAGLHASGVTLLADTLPEGPPAPPVDPPGLAPCTLSADEAYDTILFHQGQLRGIKAILGTGTTGIKVSAARAQAPATWIKHPHAATWIVDPLMLDSAFQAAIIWSHGQTGNACLPSRFDSLRVYEPFAGSTGDVTITLCLTEQTTHAIRGDVTFVDDTGRVIATMTGFEAVIAPSLMAKFKPADNQHSVRFTREQILAFAEGKPSMAFGKPYAIFDSEREIARLPRPPYFFMDRVVKTDAIQWEMTPGGWIEAEFDLPRDAWYFKAARSRILPFSILLEIALQPCGWLAAYAGSALRSDQRLYFRNLGGQATLVRPVTWDMGTLTMRSRLTGVSEAGGLIIQEFDMAVLNNGEALYTGKTSFGFFTEKALSNQTGIKATPLGRAPSKSELKNAVCIEFTDDAPLTPGDSNASIPTGLPSKALRMIDRIDVLTLDGGLFGNGYVRAAKAVDPDEWFFKAHFYQDPVCPGSLGIESFLQIVAAYAKERWDFSPETHEMIPTGQDHKWTYRGQITPDNRRISVEAHIRSVTDGKNPTVTADGILRVDGLIIYQMEGFTLELCPVSSVQDQAAAPGNCARCCI